MIECLLTSINQLICDSVFKTVDADQSGWDADPAPDEADAGADAVDVFACRVTEDGICGRPKCPAKPKKKG